MRSPDRMSSTMAVHASAGNRPRRQHGVDPTAISRTSTSANGTCGWRARRTSCSASCAARCPVHWTAKITRVPGRGRLLVGHDRGRRPHRQPRLADVLVGARRRHGGQRRLPDRADARDVHRDGPAQARPHQGAVPGGLHAEADRRARGRDPRDRDRRARPARGPRDVRPRHRRRAAGRLARDRQLHGHPARGRRGLGEPDELDARRGRPGPQPRGHRGRARARHPRDLRALPRDDRRPAREPDRRPHERARARRGRRAEARGARDRDGLLPAGRRRQRQHEGDLLAARCRR